MGNLHDGWGVAFYQGNDVALFREPNAAENSPLVKFLETQGPMTTLAISHIRHATRGALHFSNTQPFTRELGGRMHVFAHNGDLPGILNLGSSDHSTQKFGATRPIGQTDSEVAFCVLLARLTDLWNAENSPSIEARLSLISVFAADLRELGPANFLYADGDALFAHGHKRINQVSGHAEPPGLWMLQRHCPHKEVFPTGQSGVSIQATEQAIVLIASVPLSSDVWTPLAEAEIVVVQDGEVVREMRI
jgi:glutamine amidotransferase